MKNYLYICGLSSENGMFWIRPPTLWLKNEKFGYEGERLIQPHETTVVGNILENPELLK